MIATRSILYGSLYDMLPYSDPIHQHVFWYDYAIMVPSLPSDPIHFHVFWYEYAIHMTNDYGITIPYYWVRG